MMDGDFSRPHSNGKWIQSEEQKSAKAQLPVWGLDSKWSCVVPLFLRPSNFNYNVFIIDLQQHTKDESQGLTSEYAVYLSGLALTNTDRMIVSSIETAPFSLLTDKSCYTSAWNYKVYYCHYMSCLSSFMVAGKCTFETRSLHTPCTNTHSSFFSPFVSSLFQDNVLYSWCHLL